MITENIPWLEQANNILNNLNMFPSESTIILMIRHSEREPLNTNKKNKDLQLTQIGHFAAKFVGTRLPVKRRIRIYYSNRDRCRDTAYDIINAFKNKGGTIIDEGVLNPLYALKSLRNGFFKEELQHSTLLEIMNRWIDSQYDISDIESIASYSKRAAYKIWLDSAEKNEIGDINIHVSHEVLLMALRSGWFNLSPNKKWTKFLGGYAFSLEKEYLLLLDFDEFLKIPYPEWWNK